MAPAVLLDAAGTIIHKPALVPAIVSVLDDRGHQVDAGSVARRHKLLAEAIPSPDEPDIRFYSSFNRRLVESLGIPCPDELAEEIHAACRGLPWEPVPGVDRLLAALTGPVGIISNFSLELRRHLREHFDREFDPVFVSAEIGLRKPDPEFFARAAAASGADRVVVVGDSVALDIAPALAAGCETVLVDPLDLYPVHPWPRVLRLEDVPPLVG